MFERILIANRGEIACRIATTCRRLGVETVAVYSRADAGARHVALADQALPIGGPRPADSYLKADAILDAAKRANAQAVHPGYGFLSENPAFARACTEAGLVFIGPTARTMERVGSKASAKAEMEAAGVPVVPGYHGADQDLERLRAAAAEIGFPLMIKAAAGGGGKGMRIVRSEEKFEPALAAARREAANAFGDDQVILERYIERPRHWEVQVFGDRHGSVVHLFERDCSSQRRHQKIVEESPAPGLADQDRAALWAAGVAAARAVDYVNAGTVEFIATPAGEFHFLEINARLQVEHPVTEERTGIDLVEWQLRVAAGEPLPLEQDQIRARGHAIEARIYAEDPAAGFLPSTGTARWLEFPPGVRVDTGIREGDSVSVHYDPLVAKLTAFGADRGEARARLRAAIGATAIAGFETNLDFLARLLASQRFTEGAIDSAYLDRRLDQVLPPAQEPPAETLLAAAVVVLIEQEQSERAAQRTGSDPHSPWALADGWRLGHSGRRVVSLCQRDAHYPLSAYGAGGDYRLHRNDREHEVRGARIEAGALIWSLDGAGRRTAIVHRLPHLQVNDGGSVLNLLAEDPFAVEASDADADHRIIAPMPGRIVAVRARPGDAVISGQEVLVMEAMKMELSLSAAVDGTIAAINAVEGDFVEADALLVELNPQLTRETDNNRKGVEHGA